MRRGAYQMTESHSRSALEQLASELCQMGYPPLRRRVWGLYSIIAEFSCGRISDLLTGGAGKTEPSERRVRDTHLLLVAVHQIS